MKKPLFRIVTLGTICACLMGIAGSSMAFGQGGMRDLHAQMARLQQAQSNARAHHHRAQVHYLQGLINRLQARIDNHR